MIGLDFRKVFDQPLHIILISKLIRNGLDEIIVRWIGNCLDNRSQRVFISLEGGFQ